jgi:hypothetical protein
MHQIIKDICVICMKQGCFCCVVVIQSGECQNKNIKRNAMIGG